MWKRSTVMTDAVAFKKLIYRNPNKENVFYGGQLTCL